jgi:hypothetical protein
MVPVTTKSPKPPFSKGELGAGGFKFLLFLVLGTLGSLACRSSPEGPGGEPNDALAALVVTSDFESGAYATIDPETRAAHADIAAIHPDAVCRSDRVLGRSFIIERFGADAIDVLDSSAGWEVAAQYSVGASTNPQDIAAVSEDRAYVARLGEAELLVVHPLTGKRLGTVDLSAYADEDGNPDVTWIYSLDGRVYALLALLRDFKPSKESLVLVIDGLTGEIEDAVPLTHTNPSGKLRYNEALERFVLIETGGFSSLGGADELDGIVEYLDPETLEVSGAVITSKALGGDIIDAVIVSETKGFAIVEKGQDDTLVTELVTFNPQTGDKLESISRSSTWSYSALELTPDRTQLWLADRTSTRPGIRIFDAETNDELTDEPIDVGLPPFMICFAQTGDGALPDAGIHDTGDTETGDTEAGGGRDTDLVMIETRGDEPRPGENACPVPSAPALTVVPAGTMIEWTVPEDPNAEIQIGVSDDPSADAPEEWLDDRCFTFDDSAVGSALKLFARVLGEACETVRFFSHIYNVRETLPPAAGEPNTTALPVDDPAFTDWASAWIEPVAYGEEVMDQWMTPERAVGTAGGTTFDVVSLGRGGEIVMTFDAPIRDEAGVDLAIFENGASDGFLDLAYVEVSSDGETFVRFDSLYLGTDPVDAFGTFDTSVTEGLAGKYRVGFGHPFDLNALCNHPEVVRGEVDLLDIRFVKLMDIIGDGSHLDSFGNPIFDPYPTRESAGFDLDGIGVFHQ